MPRHTRPFQPWRYLVLAGVAILSSCGNSGQAPPQAGAIQPKAAAFIARHRLTRAAPGEVLIARATAATGKATTKSAKGLRITYRSGKLVGSGNSNLSTTSFYELSDARGRVLTSVPTRHYGGTPGFAMHVSPDGRTAHVSDVWGDGCSVYGLHGIFRLDPDAPATPARWQARCVLIPCASENEFTLPEVIGIIGHEIIFDPHLDGNLYKADIETLADSFPFPFGIG